MKRDRVNWGPADQSAGPSARGMRAISLQMLNDFHVARLSAMRAASEIFDLVTVGILILAIGGLALVLVGLAS